jgi:hypothetical protein
MESSATRARSVQCLQKYARLKLSTLGEREDGLFPSDKEHHAVARESGRDLLQRHLDAARKLIPIFAPDIALALPER